MLDYVFPGHMFFSLTSESKLIKTKLYIEIIKKHINAFSYF